MIATALAWHFVGPKLRDGRPIPPDGEWFRHEDEITPYEASLRASVKLMDALDSAYCDTLCRVEIRGGLVEQGGEVVVAIEWRIFWRLDAEPVLRAFARQCGLDVIHLWHAPKVVRQYLETGDESLRERAFEAAWKVSCDEVDSAVVRAARAAMEAAMKDAGEAARGAAREAREAAGEAAGNAAYNATRAARAAKVAARQAWKAAGGAQSQRLEQMVAAEATRLGYSMDGGTV